MEKDIEHKKFLIAKATQAFTAICNSVSQSVSQSINQSEWIKNVHLYCLIIL